MSTNKEFISSEIAPSRTIINNDITEINAALDNINNLDLVSCWSLISNQSTSTTNPNLKTKIEFLQSKIPDIKSSLTSYVDYLSDAQKTYIELSNEIIEDVEAIVNR